MNETTSEERIEVRDDPYDDSVWVISKYPYNRPTWVFEEDTDVIEWLRESYGPEKAVNHIISQMETKGICPWYRTEWVPDGPSERRGIKVYRIERKRPDKQL